MCASHIAAADATSPLHVDAEAVNGVSHDRHGSGSNRANGRSRETAEEEGDARQAAAATEGFHFAYGLMGRHPLFLLLRSMLLLLLRCAMLQDVATRHATHPCFSGSCCQESVRCCWNHITNIRDFTFPAHQGYVRAAMYCKEPAAEHDTPHPPCLRGNWLLQMRCYGSKVRKGEGRRPLGASGGSQASLATPLQSCTGAPPSASPSCIAQCVTQLEDCQSCEKMRYI